MIVFMSRFIYVIEGKSIYLSVCKRVHTIYVEISSN